MYLSYTRLQTHCSPHHPGFSRQIVALFKDHAIQFSSFDILSDEEVRGGLKTFSNWPTYPQVYVNGELVGGLDIVKVSNVKHTFSPTHFSFPEN